MEVGFDPSGKCAGVVRGMRRENFTGDEVEADRAGGGAEEVKVVAEIVRIALDEHGLDGRAGANSSQRVAIVERIDHAVVGGAGAFGKEQNIVTELQALAGLPDHGNRGVVADEVAETGGAAHGGSAKEAGVDDAIEAGESGGEE